MDEAQAVWDVFISHASEDKDAFVRPLAVALRNLGVTTWYDEFSLRVGDSLSRSIDRGLARSRFGLVVLSQHFLRKPWPERELQGLVSREIADGRVILPIWHGISQRQVLQFSPPLADMVAIDTTGRAAEDVAIQILLEVRPDIYRQHSREELKRLARPEALRDLQAEISSASLLLRAMTWPIVVIRVDVDKGIFVPIAMNDEACEFYCVKDTTGLTNVAALAERLREWIAADDWETFIADQQRLTAKAFRGGVARARVPVRFSERHPVWRFRGRSFLPLITRQERTEGQAVLMYLLYLDDSLAGALSEAQW